MSAASRRGRVPSPIGASEELARVLPVVKALAKRIRVPLSVDTYRAEVARAVIGEGASIINDISGLRYEPQLADVVAASEVALVLMHMRGRSKAMYAEAVYHDRRRRSRRGTGGEPGGGGGRAASRPSA